MAISIYSPSDTASPKENVHRKRLQRHDSDSEEDEKEGEEEGEEEVEDGQEGEEEGEEEMEEMEEEKAEDDDFEEFEGDAKVKKAPFKKGRGGNADTRAIDKRKSREIRVKEKKRSRKVGRLIARGYLDLEAEQDDDVQVISLLLFRLLLFCI